MRNLYGLTHARMERLKPFVGKTVPRTVFRSSKLPKSHGKSRVDDRRVLSGIIFINRNSLLWCDLPREYGPAKTLYNRWKRWRRVAERHWFERGHEHGVFARIMVGLAAERGEHKRIMIEVSRRTPCVRVSLRKYLEAHRTASSLGVKKGARAPDRAQQRRHEHQVARPCRCQRAADRVFHVRGSGQ